MGDTSSALNTQNRFNSLPSHPLFDPETQVPEVIPPHTHTHTDTAAVQDKNEIKAKTSKAIVNHPLYKVY